MKFNQWTLGLAAVGLVSLASAVSAEEKASSVLTALSSTLISGYVDTSAQWNFGTGNANNPPYSFGGSDKADGFNLNVVKLTIERPVDAEDSWGAGYKADLIFGPDANTLATQSNGEAADFGVKQAYVALHAPVGNGLDAKIGVWDTIIGYEVFESGNNPNFTRSYGYTIEPTTHTGVLLSYKFCDAFSANVGIADTFGPRINERAFATATDADNNKAESFKTYMGSLTVTAPESWGALKGSTLTAGVINGFSESYEENQTSYYVGATLCTPVTGLKVGAAFDYLDIHNSSRYFSYFPGIDGTVLVLGLYSSYQATEKLSFHVRGEYLDDQADFFSGSGLGLDSVKIWEATATVQYDLWKNVMSRLEVRWDHGDNGRFFGEDRNGNPNAKNAVMLAANIIYKF